VSLDFRVTDIKDYEKVCHVVLEDGSKKWSAVTSGIVHTCMGIGMGVITDKTWEEFYERTHMWEKCFGPILIRDNEPEFLTPAEIHAHIGLWTNVYPKISTAEFLKRIHRGFKFDVDRNLREFRDELKELANG
jgi:hypothetical protein